MDHQLDLFPLNRAALEKELKDREGVLWLFMVYFPKDRFYTPTATKARREKAEKKGKARIPKEQWDAAVKNARRIEEIRETLKWIGR